MLDLDDTPMVTWTAGSVVNVSWYIIANHGGGYAYRLCKNSGQVTEECFQANHLEYASETQRVIALDGSVVTTLPAVRTSKGTHPAGSTWTRNPFPMERGYISPIPGQPELSGRGPFTVALQDQVKIPADLTPGNYVLSFRWDAEQVQQVWAQCSDVTIVAPSAAAPAPAAVERRASSARYAVCLGDSLGLDVNECDAWAKVPFVFKNEGIWRRAERKKERTKQKEEEEKRRRRRKKKKKEEEEEEETAKQARLKP